VLHFFIDDISTYHEPFKTKDSIDSFFGLQNGKLFVAPSTFFNLGVNTAEFSGARLPFIGQKAAMYLAIVCHALRTPHLKLSLEQLYKEVAPFGCCAFIIATLHRYRTIPKVNGKIIGWRKASADDEISAVKPLLQYLAVQAKRSSQIKFPAATSESVLWKYQFELPRQDRDKLIAGATKVSAKTKDKTSVEDLHENDIDF